jgi:site-specific DNA recombinase
MRRAALYVRVSTELQEKEQTIQSQLAAVTRYADAHDLHHTPALTYTDDGYTGTRLDRPGLDELRDHAREGRFDVVVVLCPDRLARRYAYQVLLLEELKRGGVDILFCERPIDDTPDDQLLLQIQGAMAEYERAKILERCRRGRLHRARRGELAPPAVPYGYTYAARKYGGDGQIRIHEEEAAMVRQIFAWYVGEGTSLYNIQRRLVASSWKMRNGKNGWCTATIHRILRCEWYVGRAYCNRRVTQLQDRPEQDGRPRKIVHSERPQSEWIVVSVPRMIDDEVFSRAQQQIEENQRFARRRQKRHFAYLLKGLLKCGACGRSYVGHGYTKIPKNHGFAEHRYYSCSGTSVMPVADRCKNGHLLVVGADEVVWSTIRDLLLDNDALVGHLRSWLDRTAADPTGTERLKQVAGRLHEMNRQRERLIDAYQTGALGLADFGPRKRAIEERILAAEGELANLQSWEARRELSVRHVASAEAIVESLRAQLTDANFNTRQTILRLVVERVVVTAQRMEIHLALPVSRSSTLSYVWGAKPREIRTWVLRWTIRSPSQDFSVDRRESCALFDMSLSATIEKAWRSVRDDGGARFGRRALPVSPSPRRAREPSRIEGRRPHRLAKWSPPSNRETDPDGERDPRQREDDHQS